MSRAITLRGLCQEVAALYGQQAKLCYMPFDEFARELGYVTTPTMQVVAEHLRALGLLD